MKAPGSHFRTSDRGLWSPGWRRGVRLCVEEGQPNRPRDRRTGRRRWFTPSTSDRVASRSLQDAVEAKLVSPSSRESSAARARKVGRIVRVDEQRRSVGTDPGPDEPSLDATAP